MSQSQAKSQPNPYSKAIVPPSKPAPASPSTVIAKKEKSKKAEGPNNDALKADILALGGNEDEMELLLQAESDSEIEDNEAEAEVDPGLTKDLQNLFKSLNFPAPRPSKAKPLPSKAVEKAIIVPVAQKEEESESDEEEEEEEVQTAKKVASPVVAEVAPKKESKFEREERRKVERAAAKEKELAEKQAGLATTKEKPFFPKRDSPWIIDPTPQWYSVPLPALPPSKALLPAAIAPLKIRAQALLKKENDLYSLSLSPHKSTSSAPPPPNGLSKSDQTFIQQILTSGTTSDKISALLLLVSSSPLHTMTYLDQLLAMSKKKSREESGKVLRGVVDWWRGVGGGAPTRKLKAFSEQSGLGAIEGMGKDAERFLVLWAFEDWLKAWFFDILKSVEQMSTDPLLHPRIQAVMHLSNLLRDKPEQESNILRLLVNKLGDSQRNIASKTSHQLLQILQYHPGMTPILVREVSALILRPSSVSASSNAGHVRFDKNKPPSPPPKDTGHDHAKYYGIITLNQVVLTRGQAEVAGKMIEVYFEIFGDVLGRLPDEDKVGEGDEEGKDDTDGKKRKRGGGEKDGKKGGKKGAKKDGEVGENDSKLIAAVLTGVNRAFPFANLDDEAFKRRIDILFRITHTGTFNVSIQALLLIFHVSASKKDISDRFYRTLYGSLFDHRLASSSKQALYLNLVLKATKLDPNAGRVAAFVKRLVQVMLGMEVTFILGSLWIVGELISTVSGLRKLLTEPEKKEEEAVVEAVAGTSEATLRSTVYDGKKREPQFANAQNSCLWELVPLLHHYHPSVALHAEQLLSGSPMSASSMDLEQHSLNHFLDRFVYREAKKVAPTKGSSMMQPGLAGQDRSGRILLKKGPAAGKEDALNSEAFKGKDEKDVPVDQLFFHKYFVNKTARSDDRVKASKKRKSKKGAKDGASSDEESIGDPGFSDNEGEFEGLEAAMGEADEEEASDEDVAEDEIWKAMKRSMPKATGDDDMDEDDAEDDDDDEDLAAYDYSDSEDGEDEGGKVKSAFADEDDFDDDDGLAEDEDDLIGSDEDMPLFESEDDGSDDGKPVSKSQERQKKKRKLKHLPTFATAEDYAHLLGGDDNEDDE